MSDLEPGTSDAAPRIILLVDDDPDLRSLTRTFLEHEGYLVLTAGDAERAVQIFHHATPAIDLLITDFYMPQRSGLELALELKQARETLPVLLISGGFLGTEPLDRVRGEGWSFLRKPFGVPDLLAAVHHIFHRDDPRTLPDAVSRAVRWPE